MENGPIFIGGWTALEKRRCAGCWVDTHAWL